MTGFGQDVCPGGPAATATRNASGGQRLTQQQCDLIRPDSLVTGVTSGPPDRDTGHTVRNPNFRGRSPPAATALTPTSAQPEHRHKDNSCLLYTSPSPRDGLLSRMPSSA